MKNGAIFDDFLHVLNIYSNVFFELPERLNEPITTKAAEFLYLANRHFPSFDEGDRASWELGQAFRSEIISIFSDGNTLHELLSKKMVEEIKAFYWRGNKELAIKSRPDLKGQLFVDEPVMAVEEARQMGNSFGTKFVKWVVDQWKIAHSMV